MSPSQDFVNGLAAFSAVISGVLALGLLISIILSLSTRDDYEKAVNSTNAQVRRTKFADLRLARIWRMVVLAALAVSLLVLAVCQSVIMQQRLIDSPVSDPSLLGQVDTYMLNDGSTVNVPMDPNGALSGAQLDLSDYNSGLPWLIIAWMAFAVVLVLLIVQLWAQPWATYDQTGDGQLDKLYRTTSKLRAEIETLQKEAKSLRKQGRKVVKQRLKVEKEHFNTLRDYSRALDDQDAVMTENLSLVETLTRVEHERSRLQDEVDRLTPEEE